MEVTEETPRLDPYLASSAWEAQRGPGRTQNTVREKASCGSVPKCPHPAPDGREVRAVDC